MKGDFVHGTYSPLGYSFGKSRASGEVLIYLTDGYLNLAIIQKRPHYKEGLYHFGMEVDDVEKLKSVCKEFGAASEIQKRPANREAEYRVADPDGNLIDLSQHGWPV